CFDYCDWVWLFFFFQAEDGIRDGHVTGVQTCALPIFAAGSSRALLPADWFRHCETMFPDPVISPDLRYVATVIDPDDGESDEERSEERRVGKECRSRRSPYH